MYLSLSLSMYVCIYIYIYIYIYTHRAFAAAAAGVLVRLARRLAAQHEAHVRELLGPGGLLRLRVRALLEARPGGPVLVGALGARGLAFYI